MKLEAIVASPSHPRCGLKGFAPCSMFSLLLLFTIDYSLSLCMVLPHPVLLSQRPVEYLA
jgi:hypothetical protein